MLRKSQHACIVLVGLGVVALLTAAGQAAKQPGRKAIAVQLEALAPLAVAAPVMMSSTCTRNTAAPHT